MTRTIIAFALALAAGSAAADTAPRLIIETLCGSAVQNEVAGPDDVSANPGGYYIRSLATQLSFGDPRIVRAVGDTFHLCTRPASTPAMEPTRVIRQSGTQAIKYLFVPHNLPSAAPAS